MPYSPGTRSIRPAISGPSSELEHPVRGRPRPVEQLDGLAARDERRRDEPDRRHRPEEAHHQADQSPVEVVGAGVEALVDGVRQPGVLAVGPAVAHQVEGDALVGEDLGVEAGDEPSARLPMQRRRHEMPDRETRRSGDGDAEIGHRGEQDDATGLGDVGAMEFGEGRDEVGARRRRPDRRLAEQRGDRQHDHGQGPGLAPAFRDPVGRDQAPERRELFKGHASGEALLSRQHSGISPIPSSARLRSPGTPGIPSYNNERNSAACHVNDW